MIDTKTEELAALYVLDTLEGSERTAFEQRMRQDPEVADLVRALSAGLHSPLRSMEGPERLDLLDGIHSRLGHEMPSRSKVPSERRRSYWTYAWAAAASVLLVLNLFLLAGSQGGVDVDALQDSLKRQAALEEENRIMRSFNQSWEDEYMTLARRVLPFFASRDGIGEFRVIDLVDVQDTVGHRQQEDYDDLAEYWLSNRPTAAGGSGEASARFASVNLDKHAPESAAPTVGFVVWREDDHTGYMDIYNLPRPARGMDRFLWARANEDSAFVPVGFLPDLDKGSGSFYFNVDQEDFVPAQILLTEEPMSGPGKEPSSRRIMIGP